jgi:polyisoprenoid-binding protein YceI
MMKKVLLGVGALIAVAGLALGIWFLRLTAPGEVSSEPPVAPTLAVATATAPAAAVTPATPVAAGAVTPASGPGASDDPPPPAPLAARVYRIDPAQSEASYSVEEVFFDVRGLVTAVGRTRAVAGDILIDRGNLAASRVGEIVVDISQLRSDEPSRDNAIRNRWLESRRYPYARFQNAVPSGLPASVTDGVPFTFQMTGDLTVRTATAPATWVVTATLAGDTLRGTATTAVKMTQFGFDPPRLMDLRVEDDVRLALDFVAIATDGGSAPPTATAAVAAEPPPAGMRDCAPTPSEQGRPNYRPNAPERASVGAGHVLQGVVRSSRGCAPLAGAQLEFWLTNPAGAYDDDHRATLFTDASGAFRFESNVPGAYGGGSPHIHFAVTAAGHRDLVLTYILEGGQTEQTYDLVLAPTSR